MAAVDRFAVAVIAAFASAVIPVSYPVLVGTVVEHTVSSGDTLQSVGSRRGVDARVFALENGLTAGSPLRAGQRLRIDSRHIVPPGVADALLIINIPQRMLFFAANGEVVSYPVAVGSRAWPTPVAPFRVVAKETDPTWDVPASIAAEARTRGRVLPRRVPPGPANPLGRHWLGLSLGSVGIHGTNVPLSLFTATTHGCIRLHPDDVADLYDRVQVGTVGRFIYEPLLLAADGPDIFLEVHPDVYRRSVPPALGDVRERATQMRLTERIDWSRAAAVVEAREGLARIITKR